VVGCYVTERQRYGDVVKALEIIVTSVKAIKKKKKEIKRGVQ